MSYFKYKEIHIQPGQLCFPEGTTVLLAEYFNSSLCTFEEFKCYILRHCEDSCVFSFGKFS